MNSHEHGLSIPMSAGGAGASGVTLKRSGWFKSSYTQKNGCVEVNYDGDSILVRDTKYLRDPANDPAQNPTIAIPWFKWNDFLEKVLDPSVCLESGMPIIELHPDGGATVRGADGTTLAYNEIEWTAFRSGVRDEEFALVAA
jgi:hypothetical protein